MMVALGVYVRRGQRTLRKFLTDSRVHAWAQCAAWLLSGFAMSAASLGSRPQPLALGLLLATAGWPTVLFSAGSMAGYLLFWGAAGAQGVVWIMAGTVAAVLLGDREEKAPTVSGSAGTRPPVTVQTAPTQPPETTELPETTAPETTAPTMQTEPEQTEEGTFPTEPEQTAPTEPPVEPAPEPTGSLLTNG